MPDSSSKQKSNSTTTTKSTYSQVILDTSVLLYDAMAIYSFNKADIHIPFCVLEEIDTFKRDMGEKGRSARQFNRCMDLLRQENGPLTKGVQLSSGSRVFINTQESVPDKARALDLSKVDHRILATALWVQKQHPRVKVELVTKDINLRIKADLFGISARDYDPDLAADFEDLYTGIQKKEVTMDYLEQFKKEKFLSCDFSVYPNQYIVMKNGKEEMLGRYDSKKGGIVPLYEPSGPVWGVYPRNIEQSCALDALMNDQLMCVSLLGKAGTGKTLLALAVGLHKTLDENAFQKLLVSRPVFPMGRDIGYLPGDITQKLNPWMQPIFDSIEFLMGLGKKASRLAQDLIQQGLVNIEPLAYIRGRSIPNQYLIVDEAQNLTPHEIKTVLTRAGHGTKVILTGDCYQIDNPYVDSSNNGLVFSVEKFKMEALAAHVTLSKGERSDLAERAANIL